MAKFFQRTWSRWRAWHARRSRVARVSLWLLEALAVSLIVGQGLGLAGKLCVVVDVFCAIALAPLLLILFVRWITQRVLWKVRNRLILTYLLMGLAPVVLFATLAGIAAYLFCGQYATNSALSALDQASTEVRDEAASAALLRLPNQVRAGEAAAESQTEAPAESPISVDVLKDGLWKPLVGSGEGGGAIPVLNRPLPPGLHPGFRGIVALNQKLYICSIVSVPAAGRSLTVLGSMPVNEQTLSAMAKSVGSIRLMHGISSLGSSPSDDAELRQQLDDAKLNDAKLDDAKEDAQSDEDDADFASVKGGVLPPRSHFYDAPVLFSAPLSVTSWKTGKPGTSPVLPLVVVLSRPSLLYAHLFATSANTGVVVRVALIGIAIVFGLLELLALLMAAGLSRTITRSVADLYRGTKEIDAGNLAHRVRVARHDQLGALATSFNSMAASVSDLLQQQREKDRLLNELSIAREVQTNLFPKSPANLAEFEMHAVCLPASTIGGDYFDFIFGQHKVGNDGALCLALGDISGKGISAALLMASLHSAVRAFILNVGSKEGSSPSPALLLELINRHLYRSTQVERYATLFLACYDSASRTLTYSNGGHLAPLVLSSDGTVRPLDCGGPVVGLLNGLEYVEATVQLQPGDLLMAFSDGLTEPENAGNEFGAERLLDYVRQNRQQPLPVLAANTLKAVQAWIGDNEQPDDMTLLLARQL